MKRALARRAGLACTLPWVFAVGQAAAAVQDGAQRAWATLAGADVRAIHAQVLGLHPALRDPQTPDFAARLDRAYQRALAAAATARSWAGWQAAVQGFVLSFRDGHTFIRFETQPVRLRWPGFLIDGQGGGYVAAAMADDGVTGTSVPAAGDRLLGCDGQAIEDLLRIRLDAKQADWSKPPERIRQAWRLFVAAAAEPSAKAPVAVCRFEHQGSVRDLTLKWRTDAAAVVLAAADRLQRLRAPAPANERIWQTDGSLRITLGSFGNERTLNALLAQLQAEQAAWRAAPYSVFDLRGNRGGNSTWGSRLGAVLFGDAAVDALQNVSQGSTGKYFRASASAVQRLRETAGEFAAMGPDMAEVTAYWRDLAERVARHPQGDATLFTDYVNPPTEAGATRPVPIHRKPVFVLTDAGCFSSCVIAANTLLRLGGIAVGEMTGRNEEYGEITGPIALPSGLARLWLPLSIIRQDADQLGGQPLAHPWPGDLRDDAGIFAWLAALAAEPARLAPN